MSYFRIYPKKQNTAFRYLNTYSPNGTFGTLSNNSTISTDLRWSTSTNTGANPIMELHDGKSESVLLFSFELPRSIRNKIQVFDFKSKLVLYDAGTLFEPAIKLKNLKLSYFIDDFSEGDGYAFLKQNAVPGTSNFINRDSINTWNNTTFTDISTYTMNRINEDLKFDVSDQVLLSAQDEVLANFKLIVDNKENDLKNLYAKYIHSAYTKTVFKPYLEFFINDTVTDNHMSLYGGKNQRLFLLNSNRNDFSSSVFCNITFPNNTTESLLTTNTGYGLYFVDVLIPPYSTPNDVIVVNWTVNNITKFKEVIEIKDPDDVVSTNLSFSPNLAFYPIAPYINNLVTRGDVIPFEVVSEIRGYGSVIAGTYEYRVLSMDGFEMCPWTDVSTHKDKMFFSVDTAYFYPELQYEVFIRNKTSQFTITGSYTYKFRLVNDSASKLRDLTSSPYYSRDSFFNK